jgi:hypothetical protein
VSSADPATNGPRARGTAVAAVVVGLATAATGLLTGWIWSQVAPHFALTKVSGGYIYADSEPEQGIAGDGWFLIIGAAAGILLGSLAWLLARRWRGPAVLVALTLGSLGAAWIGYVLGHHIDLAHLEAVARAAPVNARVRGSLSLRVTGFQLSHPWRPRLDGVLAAQALFACFTYVCCAGWSRFATLRGPDPEDLLTDQVELSSARGVPAARLP